MSFIDLLIVRLRRSIWATTNKLLAGNL